MRVEGNAGLVTVEFEVQAAVVAVGVGVGRVAALVADYAGLVEADADAITIVLLLSRAVQYTLVTRRIIHIPIRTGSINGNTLSSKSIVMKVHRAGYS